MNKLNLTLACWDYDRTRALMDPRATRGRRAQLSADGGRGDFLPHAAAPRVRRRGNCRSRPIASRCRAPSSPSSRSRCFRRASSAIPASISAQEHDPRAQGSDRQAHRHAGISDDRAGVWIRGILADDYGVPVDSVTYVTGGEETPGRDEKLKLDLPARIKIERAPSQHDPDRHAAQRRDRRAPYRPRAVLLHRRQRRRAPAVRGFPVGRAHLFQAHRHISSAPASSRSCT